MRVTHLCRINDGKIITARVPIGRIGRPVGCCGVGWPVFAMDRRQSMGGGIGRLTG